MKTFAETIKRIIFATALLLTFISCSQDDNIDEIFVERQWTLSLIKEGEKELYSTKRYHVQFTGSSFNATMPNGAAINGKWEANGNSRKFQCWNINTTGNLKGDTIAEKMLQIFQNAKSYDGDTNWLQIKQQKNVFMQFYSN